MDSSPAGPDTQATTGAQLSGSVHGGQQPVIGAVVQLYAASTSGYAAASTPLLTVPVVTGFGGNFNITGDYTCPSASAQVYLTATGGNPGLAAGVLNPQSALIAALGSCGALSASTFIVINEATTTSAVWALQPFMADSAHVGTTATNILGLSNAFNSAAQLTDITHGTAPGFGLAASTISPTAIVNTIANILSACVNTSGGTAGDTTNCGKLFTYATPASGIAPADTVVAALDIARAPGTNVRNLFALISTTPPFLPTLTYAPNDLTLSLSFTGVQPFYNLAVDANQSIWAVTRTSYVGSILTFNNAGTLTSSASGYSHSSSFSPWGLAFDSTGALWIGQTESAANLYGISSNAYDASKITPAYNAFFSVPQFTSSSAVENGGLEGEDLPVIGPAGDAWFYNNGPLAQFNSTGTAISPSSNDSTKIGYQTGGGLNWKNGGYCSALALDPSANAWCAVNNSNQGGASALAEVTTGGFAVAPASGYTGGGMGANVKGVAIDHNNNVFVTYLYDPTTKGGVAKFSSTGVPLSPATGYVLNSDFGGSGAIAIDGDGAVWVMNSNSLSHLSNAGTLLDGASDGFNLPASTYSGSTTANIIIDGSGNIWNAEQFGTNIYGLVKYIGLAAPVITPLGTAVRNNTLGTRP